MKTKSLLLLALALLGGAAHAGIINIAQLPLLNITGTGTVKPNLMLLYDNSGSMASAFTPDYIDDSTSCRAGATMADNGNNGGPRGCKPGYPPFMSSDFNRQYYNPKVQYSPAVRADGSVYNSQNRTNTTTWTSVLNDAFNVNTTSLTGGGGTSVNLVTGFPDVKWCTIDGSGNATSTCGYNSASYNYPNNTYVAPVNFTANPYYFTINAAEYCTDTTLTNCQAISAVGAGAPPGYPIPSLVRWCNSRALTSCQAKYVGAYIYPRYGNPINGAVAAYGTVTIASSAGSNSLGIASITVAESSGGVVITNGAVTAATGTNSTTKQATLATDLALSIINKTGLTNQYTACVTTPTGTNSGSVSACSTWGITLGATNIVAVIPLDCAAGITIKSQCSVLTDNSRSGWGISVAATQMPATALLTITGTTSSSTAPVMSGVTLGGVQLFASSLTLAKSASASAVATAIAGKIGVAGTVKAYVGSTGGVSTACSAAASSSVCLADTGAVAGGAAVLAAISASPGISFSYTAASAPDIIPTSTAALSTGSAVFERVDIVASRTSYPKDPARTDCAGTTCTYDEEMTNFANWYTYYKTRNQMMKTSVGLAFQPITANYRVGVVALSDAAVDTVANFVLPKPFSGTDRAAWYTKLYAMSGNQSTPLRQALHAVGKMYANIAPYNFAAGSEVVQFPCQQNFTFMTTDGYWNGGAAASVLNNDNVENAARFCTRARGCLDPRGLSTDTNSLADVALYWYNGGTNGTTSSLRPTLEDMSKPGLVPAAAGDNTRLHMNTYTLGLGVDGIMNYEANYDTAPLVGGDFYKLITGVTTGCPWNSNGPYNWPDAVTSDSSSGAAYQSRVDDLWHTAVNGRGKYFSASDPKQVVAGLSSALANIQVKLGAAAAAATSTPNISQQDNDIFSDTFTTVKWYGELSDKKIDIVTGIVGSTVVWNTSDVVGRRVSAASDTRTIKWLDPVSKTLHNFKYSDTAMTALEKSWFDNKCSAMAQCPSLSASDQGIVNGGANLIDWLRGQQQYANDRLFRAYGMTDHNPSGLAAPLPIVLGDIASSKPAFMREPRKGYNLTGYSAFVSANATRAPTVFAAANDGMLHAFDATSGDELWAYVPRITMKKLYLQASTTYGTNHQYTTDGSPELGDVTIGGVWKTILVAGLNGGGRGFYAVDVTNPAAPAPLWELCADVTVCATNSDPDLGLSFGNPQFGLWKGKWVVYLTSGYNNVPGTDGVATGNGGAYLYIVDVSNGQVLAKILAGTPSVTTPQGFAKITAISADPVLDPTTTYIYGGDNQGQMWRFDLTGATVLVNKMGNSGSLQPITTRPEVTSCRVKAGAGYVAQNVVVFGTGRLLDVPDVANVDVQSVYMLKDSATEVTAWRSPTAMIKQSFTQIGSNASGTSYSVSNNTVDLSTKSGWFVDFDQNAGERVNLDPKVVSGTLNIVTNTPTSSSACSVGGTSNAYALNVCSGGFVDPNAIGTQSTNTNGADIVAGSTLSNTSAAVGFIIVRLPSGALKLVVTTADGGNKTIGPPPSITPGARKVGWRRVRN